MPDNLPPEFPAPEVEKRRCPVSGWAQSAFWLGLIGLLLYPLAAGVSLPISLVALGCAVMGMRECRSRPHTLRGVGYAIFAMLFGILPLVLAGQEIFGV